MSQEMDKSRHTENNTVLSDSLFQAYQELIRESIASDPSGATFVIDPFGHAVHMGKAYSITTAGTIAGETTKYMLSLGGNKEVHFDKFRLTASNGNMTVALYENPTVTANGTLLTPMSRNRSDIQAATKFTYANPTVTTEGTLLDTANIYDTGSIGSHLAQGVGAIDA